MRRVSEERRVKEHRGEGEGNAYKPWLRIREVPSRGTSVSPKNPKNGRIMQFLSEGEYWLYLQLLYDESIIDIREQYPLKLEDTLIIADKLGYKHPKDRETHMTTDMLATYVDDKKNIYYRAYSVKNRRDEIFGDLNDPVVVRNVEKQRIEMAYWHLHGIEFKIVFKEDMDRDYVQNIRKAMECYNINTVQTKTDMVKYLVAHKKINVDLHRGKVNYTELASHYISQKEAIDALIQNNKEEE